MNVLRRADAQRMKAREQGEVLSRVDRSIAAEDSSRNECGNASEDQTAPSTANDRHHEQPRSHGDVGKNHSEQVRRQLRLGHSQVGITTAGFLFSVYGSPLGRVAARAERSLFELFRMSSTGPLHRPPLSSFLTVSQLMHRR